MNALTFDTETNGLPKDWKAKVTEVDKWPRITQLAWSLSDIDSGDLIKEYKCLIKPDGWTIPTVDELIAAKSKDPHFFLNNNMSTERCEKEGRPITDVLAEIRDDMADSAVLVAHNMSFDEKVTGAEFIRISMNLGKIIPKICTKEAGTDFCKIPPFRYGKFKWPTLMELYTKLFNKKFDGAHDAGFDVTACRECFHELVRLGVIRL